MARQLCSGRSLTSPRKARFARDTLELAKWLILARFPFGVQDDASLVPPALAAGVRVSTSELWERLLAGTRIEDVGIFEANERKVYIREKGAAGKSPDLVCRAEDGTFVASLDAKYKRMGQPRFEDMSMGDQYQQYAYAAATGKPAIFVYVSKTREPGEPAEDMILVKDRPIAKIGVATVPFPRPDECRDITAWRKRAGERLSLEDTFWKTIAD